jgi:hypothetical protein
MLVALESLSKHPLSPLFPLELLIARNLRLVDIAATLLMVLLLQELMKRLRPLNKLAEQLGLGSH